MVQIYRVTGPTGKQYIGITELGMKARKRSHESEARNGSKLTFHNALRKHGFENFTWVVLFDGLSRTEANDLERRLIVQGNTQRPGGYNITLGGDGVFGRVYTPEQKEMNSIRGRERFSKPEEREAARQRTLKTWADPTHRERMLTILAAARRDDYVRTPRSLTDDQAREAQLMSASGKTYREIAAHFGIHYNTVKDVVHGRRGYPAPDPSISKHPRKRGCVRLKKQVA